MKIATAAEMRAVDARAIEEFRIPGACLMQSAGEALARACVEELGGSARGKRIAVFCGTGNNGGDGFVAARHLVAVGADVTVLLAADPSERKGDAGLHFAPLRAMGVPVTREVGAFGTADLLVDCLLGTGARGAPEAAIAAAIAVMNATRTAIVAADIPSGVDADTGGVPGAVVRAKRTVTFARPKPGLLLYPGAEFAGRVTVAALGMPAALFENLAMELTTREWTRAHLPVRAQGRDANKGSFGTLLVIAGSRGMAGAAVLTAVSALRMGAGLVHLAVPESVVDTAATLAPEVVLRALPEADGGTHGGAGAVEKALALAERADAVAMGPGMGTGGAVAAFVESLVQRLDRPLVVDADGLNALGRMQHAVPDRTKGTVLTPHPGEMGRLLGISTAAVQADRLGAVQRCAEIYQWVTLLKGARTLIGTPEGEMFFNRAGTPALATAGSGDVLTGAIGALLARGKTAVEAARLGAFVHALAGEIAAETIGEAGVLAGEIRDRLPAVRASLAGEDRELR